jgi:ferredoxin
MYTKVLVLRFPPEVTDKPLICDLSRKYDLLFNILKAKILPGREGLMVLELSGQKEQVREGLIFLKDLGIDVKYVEQEIRRDDDLCYQCGICTGICPTHALHMNWETMEVLFDPKKCTGCELCVAVCPVRAMKIQFSKDRVLA